MKYILKKGALLGAIILLLIGCSLSKEPKQYSSEDYKNAAQFMSRSWYGLVQNQVVSQDWTGDTVLTYAKRTATGSEFIAVHTATNEKKTAFDHQKLADGLNALLDKDFKAANLPLRKITFDEKGHIKFSIGRQTFKANLSDYSVAKTVSTEVRTRRKEHLSPNKKLAAYIDNYNLWVRDIKTGKRTQLTFDGKKNYGYATNNAGWIKSDNAVLKWSPNSDKIATFQQDAREVGMMYLTSTNVGHPKLEAWKHPLPGDDAIFTIERVIIHLGKRPKTVRLKMDKDFQRGTTTDHIADWDGTLLDAQWSKDGSQFAFVSGSRDHKVAHLQIANSKTGAVRSIHKETVDTYYESGVDAENWKVLFDSNEFIWYSEKSNWGHLYLYDLTTKKLKNQITSGDWLVKQIKHIDPVSRAIYFTGGGKESGNPYHDYLYKVGFNGTSLSNLTPEKGHHSIRFNASSNFFVDTYSTTTTAPIAVLRKANGEKIADLARGDLSALEAKGWVPPIEFNVKARDQETDLYGLLYLPSNYDENKSYPVVNYIYPGPQSGSIRNFGFTPVGRDHQALAELGFAVVAVNAMGTPGRSKSFHDAYYGNMGDNGLPDNITTIQQLAKIHKGMDVERVGIHGHSGGGFASTRALLAYPEFYDVAVSGAGNHDNRNYEADWGEKWQGLLVKNDDGTTNYDNQANQLMVDKLKGKLLITHGSMDNNVPPSSTMLVVEALIKANKDFDMLLFPNQRHGYGNMTSYMTRKRWDYFITHLRNETPPKEVDLAKLN